MRGTLAGHRATPHAGRMTDPEGPRAHHRQLPERVRPEDSVEPSAAEDLRVVEGSEEPHVRLVRGPLGL